VGAVAAALGGEGGSYLNPDPAVPGSGTPGSANFGTRIQLVISNVAAGETVYVPVSITNAVTGPNTLTLSLSSGSATGAFAQQTASTTTGAPIAVTAAPGTTTTAAQPSFAASYPAESFGASAALTPSNGTVTVVYEVTASNAGFIQSAGIPVWVTFGKNVFTTAPAQITVLESYAPTVASPTAAAPATTIPSFAPPSNTALAATTVSLCQTSLLFPFVTNQLGFDTGIALANTSTDPYGTVPSPGTCTLSFYGAGAPTPSTSVAAPGGTQASATVNAFLLSSVAPGFQGYMIANCGYVDGHGFAYIAYNLTQANGTVMGYLAEILQTPLGVRTNAAGLTSEANGE